MLMYPPSFQLCIFSVHTPARFPVGAPWRVGVGIRDSSVVLRNFDSYVPRTLSAAALDVFGSGTSAYIRSLPLGMRSSNGAQRSPSALVVWYQGRVRIRGAVTSLRSTGENGKARPDTASFTLIARKHRSTAYAFEPHNVAFEKPYHIPETIGSHRRLTSLTRS